jgi:hypothetical protein
MSALPEELISLVSFRYLLRKNPDALEAGWSVTRWSAMFWSQ